ncbi:Uma2 family endonuclease [Archangium lansingense]|uniref:Uma2 family endonuclease n=1 Tax=Archangium lansingense TaxID=2995310 RepID=A0ABT3ZUC3_9BACT|nr:Uma2 family endonuclease [Archangium lansinium]MCY1072995.1 Uma2 family endonuclease [Archangium lansinium]
MSGSKRRATYEDLETIPPNCVGEILDGALYVSPRPASPHARAAYRLGGWLSGPFDLGKGGPGGWVILVEPELHLENDALVPDLAGWRRERMPEMPHTAAFTLSPDWVCEVLSPSTAVLDREKKMKAYAREGVSHLWLVDPLQRSLEVYRLEGRRWNRQGHWSGESTVHAEPFAVLPLELAMLWER